MFLDMIHNVREIVLVQVPIMLPIKVTCFVVAVSSIKGIHLLSVLVFTLSNQWGYLLTWLVKLFPWFKFVFLTVSFEYISDHLFIDLLELMFQMHLPWICSISIGHEPSIRDGEVQSIHYVSEIFIIMLDLVNYIINYFQFCCFSTLQGVPCQGKEGAKLAR